MDQNVVEGLSTDPPSKGVTFFQLIKDFLDFFLKEIIISCFLFFDKSRQLPVPRKI